MKNVLILLVTLLLSAKLQGQDSLGTPGFFQISSVVVRDSLSKLEPIELTVEARVIVLSLVDAKGSTFEEWAPFRELNKDRTYLAVIARTDDPVKTEFVLSFYKELLADGDPALAYRRTCEKFKGRDGHLLHFFSSPLK
jgi:hypothetical protein